MLGYCPLSSGSKGNCIYFGTKNTKVLIDAGISYKRIKESLSQINVDIGEIEAILITHEHTDHIKALDVLSSNLNIPILANSDTAKAIYTTFSENFKFKIFSTGESFEFGDIEVHPFTIQHDAVDPVAFTFKTDGKKIGFCTDLGFATTLVASHLKNCDYLYLESNHEPSMVHASSRPMVYKKRVLSRQGHLSNEECANLLVEVFHTNLKHVHLAHLSSECNTPERAIEIVQNRLKQEGHNVEISIAYQDKISKEIVFS
jgi:phosphoribosyl 1,2-cyclic phosphodiesterase